MGPPEFRHFEFDRHLGSDSGAEYGLRAADRIGFSRAVPAVYRRIYARKISGARSANAGRPAIAALEREAGRVVDAIRGFRRQGGGEFLWELAGVRGAPGAAPPSHTSWEFRRLRAVVQASERVGLGFERPPPTGGHPGRNHHTPEGYLSMLDRRLDHGMVPYGMGPRGGVDVLAILSPRAQTESTSPEHADHTIGYLFLHELLGHALARIRGGREPHGGTNAGPNTADRLSSSLAQALSSPVTAAVRHVNVAWNWDPDHGTYNPLGRGGGAHP